MTSVPSRLHWLVLAGALSSPAIAPTATAVAGETSGATAPQGWSTQAPRDEIRPRFTYLPDGGPGGRGSFVIEADGREGLIGWWQKTYAVQGGRYYKFTARRKADRIETPRQTAVPRITWQDAQGRPVRRDKPTVASYRPG